MPLFKTLSQHSSKGKFILSVEKHVSFQYLSVRKHCINSLNSCQTKLLSADNRNLSKLFKRNCVKERSDIGLFYPKKKPKKREGSLIDEITIGLEIIKTDLPKYAQEWKERLIFDQDIFPEHGDFEYFKRFNGEDSVKDWMVSTDQDTSQGKSTATLTTTSAGTALFQGVLNTEVPKDGQSTHAGYCNIRSPLNKLSFQRQIPYDWSRYTHMYLRVRGDGRNYMLVIQMDRYYSHLAFDMYNYPLYTRGGPYWQIVKVPLSHFFLAFRGRTQDQQYLVSLDQIKYFSITAADNIDGPFRLEIDYIALVRDNLADNRKDFRYELYQKKMWEL